MKPSKAHLTTAQRIYDRLGRGSVADIDAIAQALAEAERGGMKRAAEIAAATETPPDEDEQPGDDVWLSRTSANTRSRTVARDILSEAES